MKHPYLLIIFLTFFSLQAVAQETTWEGLALTNAPINKMDMASIKRGAKFFATNCMSCHTMVYLRYDKVAQEAGITYDKMPVNVKNWPNNITPPDLSLEAGYRGEDWIYTYLHSFYEDSSKASGVNNLLVPNTGMPGILVPYQGQQILTSTPPTPTALYHHYQYYDALVLVKQGAMTPEEFDKTTADLVNFLSYSTEPYYIQQHKLGKWVLCFLFIFFLLVYSLKQEYWKDVKRHKEDHHAGC